MLERDGECKREVVVPSSIGRQIKKRHRKYYKLDNDLIVDNDVDCKKIKFYNGELLKLKTILLVRELVYILFETVR